jgi:hypothetical protein
MIAIARAPLPLAHVGPLLPCPFCGSAATQEPDPWLLESIRITCGNDACRVRPRTESLLVCYADELAAAWNARPPADPAPAGGRMG